MQKLFNHPDFPLYAGRYQVSDHGVVVNLITGNILKQNENPKNGSLFIRLSAGYEHSLSMGLAKLILLTFSPRSYYKGAIAIRCDGNEKNNARNNLVWGTRKMQVKIAMSNPEYAKRVQKMGLKFGKLLWQNNLDLTGKNLRRWRKENNIELSKETKQKIKSMSAEGIGATAIARQLGIARSTVHRHR